MEEILSSIKRIIAEDGDGTARGNAKQTGAKRDGDRESHRKSVVADMVRDAESGPKGSYVDEVLELTDEMPRVGRSAPVVEEALELDTVEEAPAMEMPAKAPVAAEPAAEEAVAGSSIVSVESEMAARSSLAALSSMIVKPADGSENTLEGMVREMLRPMLKEWLDANLPTLVEGMVAKEIARITGRSL